MGQHLLQPDLAQIPDTCRQYGSLHLRPGDAPNGLDLNGGARTIYVLAATGPNIVNSWGKIDGVINDTVGGGSLIKTGGGQLVLNNTNTFTGGVEISGALCRWATTRVWEWRPAVIFRQRHEAGSASQPTVGNLSGTSNYGLITAGAAGARVLTVNQTANTTFGGVIENGLGTVSLVKSGSGSLTLAGASTYTGATTVSAGTLRVDGSIAASSMTTVNGGTLSGSGTVGPLTLQGGTVSPGSSVGTLAAGATTWTDGSRLLFEIDDATGTAGAAGGPGWDLLDIAGTLDLSGLSAGGFSITIDTLLPGGGTNPGAMANFLDSSSYSWEFVRTTGGLVGAFDAGDFLLDTSGVRMPIPAPSESAMSVTLCLSPTQGRHHPRALHLRPGCARRAVADWLRPPAEATLSSRRGRNT